MIRSLLLIIIKETAILQCSRFVDKMREQIIDANRFVLISACANVSHRSIYCLSGVCSMSQSNSELSGQRLMNLHRTTMSVIK